MIFENKGWENTEVTAELVCQYAAAHGLKYVVIASKTGYTTDIFLDTFARAGVEAQFISVSHCYGDMGPGQCELTPEKRRELTDRGVRVITAIHALSGAERGIAARYGGVTPAILMADTLKMLGQGMKVGVEISLMAMDAGAVPYGEEIDPECTYRSLHRLRILHALSFRCGYSRGVQHLQQPQAVPKHRNDPFRLL